MEFVERVDKLGTYFVYHNIYERFDISFEQFIEMVDSGRWEQFINENSVTR